MQVEFRVLELLASRLCHELISPVGAINNGVELLCDGDASFVTEASTLIGRSARHAAARLQFYRFAYGAGVGGGVPKPRRLIAAVLEDSKVRCDWPATLDALTPSWHRLACNLALLAAEALPRGGTVTLAAADRGVVAAANGAAVILSAELKAAVASGADVAVLTARTVHGYFTARYAEQIGVRLTLRESDGIATFAAS